MYIPSENLWLGHPNNIQLNVKSYEAPHYVVFSSLLPTSFLLGPNIHLRTLFSNTRNLCSSLSAKDQVSYPYDKTCKIMVLCPLISRFLEKRREDKRLWTEWQQAPPLPELICSFNFFLNVILTCYYRFQVFEVCHIIEGCISYK